MHFHAGWQKLHTRIRCWKYFIPRFPRFILITGHYLRAKARIQGKFHYKSFEPNYSKFTRPRSCVIPMDGRRTSRSENGYTRKYTGILINHTYSKLRFIPVGNVRAGGAGEWQHCCKRNSEAVAANHLYLLAGEQAGHTHHNRHHYHGISVLPLHLKKLFCLHCRRNFGCFYKHHGRGRTYRSIHRTVHTRLLLFAFTAPPRGGRRSCTAHMQQGITKCCRFVKI
uniref:PE248R n=1 Tax=African swine fever virus TaxID=10497 RepID=A0A6G7KU17_ASF